MKKTLAVIAVIAAFAIGAQADERRPSGPCFFSLFGIDIGCGERRPVTIPKGPHKPEKPVVPVIRSTRGGGRR